MATKNMNKDRTPSSQQSQHAQYGGDIKCCDSAVVNGYSVSVYIAYLSVPLDTIYSTATGYVTIDSLHSKSGVSSVVFSVTKVLLKKFRRAKPYDCMVYWKTIPDSCSMESQS